MKKIIFLVISAMMLTSCEKNVEFNNPAFQGLVNNTLWKSSTTVATKSATGAITIKGIAAAGNLNLTVNSTALGTRVFGTTNPSNMVSYSLANATSSFDYTTNITPAGANKIKLLTAGLGYTTSKLVTTTGGTGTGLKVDIEANATGIVTSVVVNAPGDNYQAGDVISIVGGNGNATFIVENVTKSNGEITITEYDGATITGNFKFTAFDTASGTTTSCRDGVFYKIPVN
ncbi:MAG: hypothetical protein RL494_1736 [Bacteroidota bacterium]|jgi:hypothetical protein